MEEPQTNKKHLAKTRRGGKDHEIVDRQISQRRGVNHSVGHWKV